MNLQKLLDALSTHEKQKLKAMLNQEDIFPGQQSKKKGSSDDTNPVVPPPPPPPQPPTESIPDLDPSEVPLASLETVSETFETNRHSWQGDNPHSSSLPQHMPTGLVFGIILFPVVFAWFTLNDKYSVNSRIISFVWLIFWLIIILPMLLGFFALVTILMTGANMLNVLESFFETIGMTIKIIDKI